jgi:hypothetical protein
LNVRMRNIMKTETELIREHLEEHCEGAITYDGCDSALIGIAKLVRENEFVDVAIYSYERLVNHFKEEYLSDTENPITEDEAEMDAMEWVDYNITGGYLGTRTPLIISME